MSTLTCGSLPTWHDLPIFNHVLWRLQTSHNINWWKDWLTPTLDWFVNCSSTWQLQHSHNIILVGHKFGCIFIKSLLNEVNKVAHRKKFADVAEKEAKDSCEAFQHNLSGIMFYSVPHFMTKRDIQIVFQEKKDRYKVFSGCSSEPGTLDSESSILESTSWRVISHQIEAINEDFEDSIAHYHTKICVISHGLTMPKEVNSLTFMLHHVLGDGHINILAFVAGHPCGKSWSSVVL